MVYSLIAVFVKSCLGNVQKFVRFTWVWRECRRGFALNFPCRISGCLRNCSSPRLETKWRKHRSNFCKPTGRISAQRKSSLLDYGHFWVTAVASKNFRECCYGQNQLICAKSGKIAVKLVDCVCLRACEFTRGLIEFLWM